MSGEGCPGSEQTEGCFALARTRKSIALRIILWSVVLKVLGGGRGVGGGGVLRCLLHTCKQAHTYVHKHTYTHKHIHINTHTHKHTHI